MEKIDNLDRQILEIISQNARIPFKDVAAECGFNKFAGFYLLHPLLARINDLFIEKCMCISLLQPLLLC